MGMRRSLIVLNVVAISLVLLLFIQLVGPDPNAEGLRAWGKRDGHLSGTLPKHGPGRRSRGLLQVRKSPQNDRKPARRRSRWDASTLQKVGLPLIVGRDHAAEERALHFRAMGVSDFFEAIPEWPEVKIGSDLELEWGVEASEQQSNSAKGALQSSSTSQRNSVEQMGSATVVKRPPFDPRSLPDLIIRDSGSFADFSNRDPDFDSNAAVLQNVTGGETSSDVDSQPLRRGQPSETSSLEQVQEAGLGAVTVTTNASTQAQEANPNFFANPETAPMLVNAPQRSARVYIYDLPPHLNRDFVDQDPRVRKTMFATEVLIHEDFEQSAVRTLDPEEADFFFIPVYTAAVLEESGRTIPDTSASTMLEAVTYVAERWPYFNRLRGLDHVVVAPHDYGACFQYRDELASQTKFRMVLRYLTVLQTFGVHNHVCYRQGRSVVIPPYIDVRKLRQLEFAPERDPHEKSVLAFFRGLYIDAGNDATGQVYSRGVRLAIGQTFANHPDFDISDKPSPTYLQDMMKATFCLCPLGWAPWSPRIFESVQIGCIPVIIADDIILPFEDYFNWERIAVRVKEADVPRLEEILKGIPPEKVAAMQKAMWDPKVRQALIFPEPAESGDAFDMVLNELEAKVDRIRKKRAEYMRKHGQ